jgi:hypothetical protein
MFPLLDDGMYSHRDDVAGDLVYSNTLTIQYDSEGDINFAATSSQFPSDLRLVGKITVLSAPNQTHDEAGFAFAQQMQTQLENLVSAGFGRAQALSNVRDAVSSELGIPASAITVSGRSVLWRTLEGLTYIVYLQDDQTWGRRRHLLVKDAMLGRPYHASSTTQQHPFLRAAAAPTPGEAGR